MVEALDYFIKKEFAEPIYLHDVLVSNRVHQDQISLRYNASPNSANDLDREVKYCISKHLEWFMYKVMIVGHGFVGSAVASLFSE